VCPPRMGELRLTEAGVIYNRPGDLYFPGTYTTARFQPAFSFTRTETFSSGGERVGIVELDTAVVRRFFQAAAGRVGSVLAFGGPLATEIRGMTEDSPINREEGFDWASNLVVAETSFAGFAAAKISFVAHCPDQPTAPARCDIAIPGLEWWWFRDGEAVTMIETRIGDTPFVVLVATEQEEFDTYWTEVAQPILNSIEFLEP
jgi:hypothetical protein